MNIYLCGGLKSGWQDEVDAALEDHDCIDPRDFPQKKDGHLGETAKKERKAIQESDLVFAYLEASNTRPVGIWAEIVYAVENDVPVIFVDEWQDHRTEWFTSFAELSFVYESLEAGIRAVRESR